MTDNNTDVLTFRKVNVTPVSATDRTATRDNLLQFYTRDGEPQVQAEPEGINALYSRLSQEDANDGESNSIANQKKILERYCMEHNYFGTRHYEDDGYSGTNFNRPGFQEMLSDIKAGKIARVIVKDMSRFGRDYLQVGMYTDMLFPDLGVHFIAVSDGVDSKRGDNEFTAIRNIFNEMYARDTSKKIRAAFQAKGKSGEHLCSRPPYGYMKDPDNPKKWIVDDEAAAVVQQIFSLCISGVGTAQIAVWLCEHKIITPSAYRITKGFPSTGRQAKDVYHWSSDVVSRILGRMEYLGYTINFKTRKLSYKSREFVYNDPSDWAVFENTQEPIIEESVFMVVQNVRKGKRRRTRHGIPNIFSGLLYCADCGKKLYFACNHKYGLDAAYYNCSFYREAKTCTSHYIRHTALNEILLQNLREAIAYVAQYESDFICEASANDTMEHDRGLAKKKQSLEKTEARVRELDNIIKHLYEDNVSGKLTDERFVKLSHEYEREQSDLGKQIERLRDELKAAEQRKGDIKSFIKATKKYTDLKELDAAVLREFVEKIYVHEKDKESKTQEIQIVYNFIGAFDFEGASEISKNVSPAEKRTA